MRNFTFQRTRSNCSYTKKTTIDYNDTSKNTFIITDKPLRKIKNMRDTFIYNIERTTITTPITEQEHIQELIKRAPIDTITYITPTSVETRETIQPRSKQELTRIIEKTYGITARNIQPITTGRAKEGIHLIDSADGRFIFKYRGQDKHRAETLMTINGLLKEHFPRPIRRIDDDRYTISLNDDVFGLERFIEGKEAQRTNPEYATKTGTYIARFHNDLDDIFKDNEELALPTQEDAYNESNILSFYMDTLKDEQNNILNPLVKQLIDEGISSRLKNIPYRQINGDLNSTNIIITDKDCIVIDNDTHRHDARIKEFIAPLLIDGNLTPPSYVPGSMHAMIEAYDQEAREPLTREERELIPLLLKAAMIKYHIVGSIRKGENTGQDAEDINAIIDTIGGESRVH